MLGLDADRPPEPEQDPFEVLVDILGRDGSERPATHVARDEQAAANSLARLVPEYLHAYALHAEATYGLKQVAVAALGPDLGQAVIEDTAWPHLSSALAQLAGAGRNPGSALVAAAAQRELGSADSAAEVLAWRLAPSVRGLAHGEGLLIGVPQPPLHIDADPLSDWLHQRAERIRSRVDGLSTATRMAPPPWLNQLGPRPSNPGAAHRWDATLASVVAYRDQHRIADAGHPVGPRPDREVPQQQAWKTLQVRLVHAQGRARLAPPTPRPSVRRVSL
jgi:hypothetical protein